MIKGMHGMFYSSEPEKLRLFFKEVLELPATDIGEGWLIYDIKAADLGVHPSKSPGHPETQSGTADISFFCENLEESVEKLKAKGAIFKGPIEDHGYGFVTFISAPGNFWIQLYQPKYSK